MGQHKFQCFCVLVSTGNLTTPTTLLNDRQVESFSTVFPRLKLEYASAEILLKNKSRKWSGHIINGAHFPTAQVKKPCKFMCIIPFKCPALSSDQGT